MLPVAIAVCGFLAAFIGIHYGRYSVGQLRDTQFYFAYAKGLRGGLIPYRDFPVPYPPLSFVVFLLPALLARGSSLASYEGGFGLVMAACFVIAFGSAVYLLAHQQPNVKRLAVGVGMAVLTPLLLGSVILSRYDAWPAALTSVALALVFFGRFRTGFGVLGLAVAAKGYPIVLLPLFGVYVRRVSHLRRVCECGAVFAAALLTACLPFLVFAPRGVWASVYLQGSRGLEVESLGAAVLLAAHHLVGLHLSLIAKGVSMDLGGGAASFVASLLTFLQIAALCVVYLDFCAGPGNRRRLLSASAAAVCAFVAFSRVLSPQYLIWLVPFVIAVPGRRWLVASVLLCAAMALTQYWFPYRFFSLAFRFAAAPSWAVLARDCALVGLFGTLAWPSPGIRRGLHAALSRGRSRFASALPRVGAG